ncbi:MAG: hypothetical protein ACI9HK_004050 [Pirellulaceae bacterium]|jgi:hypothetical protein
MGSGMGIGLSMIIMLVVGIVSPVMFALSLCATFVAVLPVKRDPEGGTSHSTKRKETPQVTAPRIHPLDRPD